MKKLVITVLLSLFATPAFADHTLADAMATNAKLAEAVNAIQSAASIVCNNAQSNQEYFYKREVGRSGTAWKQTSSCSNGKELMVAYKWLDYGPGDIIAITLK